MNEPMCYDRCGLQLVPPDTKDKHQDWMTKYEQVSIKLDEILKIIEERKEKNKKTS